MYELKSVQVEVLRYEEITNALFLAFSKFVISDSLAEKVASVSGIQVSGIVNDDFEHWRFLRSAEKNFVLFVP